MATVRVFARVKAKAGKEEQLREQILTLVRASRAEDGVEFYEVFETNEGGEFLFSEQYASPEDFESHKSSEHFKAAGQAFASLIDGELVIWEVDPLEPVD